MHLSPNRYWSIGGVWNDDFETNMILRFNGTSNQSNGYLDNDFINNSEDSLVVLYKAKPEDDWSLVDSFEVNTQGNPFNKLGQLEVFNAQPGDYVLAIYDQNIMDDALEVNTCKFTGITEIKGEKDETMLHVYPVPSSDYVVLSLEQEASSPMKTIDIYDVSGKLVHTVNELNTSEIKLNTSTWHSGHYFIHVKDKNEQVLGVGRMQVK